MPTDFSAWFLASRGTGNSYKTFLKCLRARHRAHPGQRKGRGTASASARRGASVDQRQGFVFRIEGGFPHLATFGAIERIGKNPSGWAEAERPKDLPLPGLAPGSPNRFVAVPNTEPKPLHWVKDPDTIIAAVRRAH